MNYYEILRVSKKANTEEIKSSFREISKELHPDKVKILRTIYLRGVRYSVEGTEDTFETHKEAMDFIHSRYLTIIEAYEVLSDPNRRKEYDHTMLIGTSDPNETKAITNIFSMFEDILSSPRFDPETQDLIGIMGMELEEVERKMLSDIEDNEINISTLIEVKGRIKGAEFLVNKVDQLIDLANTNIEVIKDAIKINDISKNLLSKASYNREVEQIEMELGEENKNE